MPLVVLLLALLLPALAHGGTTLAVLPLEKSTGSAAYDGLGVALSGMVIADLAEVPGLVLVERARLDAILDELALAEGAFLDPATAQRVGRGVGAQVVVIGSWGVVEGTFLLDARVVEVETSRVVRAARAEGPVEAFVAVEKELVEGLLDQLEVRLSMVERRRLQLQAPTESFGAFAAYGEGLARTSEGRLDEAASAFEQALRTDPDFADARSALATLRARVERMRREDAAEAASDREHRLNAVLAETAEVRAMPDRPWTLEEHAAWALRLAALHELELHCERLGEMVAYFERVEGAVGLPESAREPFVLVRALSEVAWTIGLEDRPTSSNTYSRDMRIMNAASILGNPVTFLLDLDRVEPNHTSSRGLYATAARCTSERDALARIDGLRPQLAAWGVAEWTTDKTEPAVTVADELEAFLLRARVRERGLDPEAEARIGALLDRHDATAARGWARRVAEAAVVEGEAWRKHRAMRQGLPETVLLGMARAVAAADAGLLRADTPFCARVLPRRVDEARAALARWEDERSGSKSRYAPWTLSRIGVSLGPLLDFGCLAGIDARFATLEEAAAWLDAGPTRLDADRASEPACVEAAERVAAVGYAARIEALPRDLAIDVVDSGLLGWYGSMEATLCAPASRAGSP